MADVEKAQVEGHPSHTKAMTTEGEPQPVACMMPEAEKRVDYMFMFRNEGSQTSMEMINSLVMVDSCTTVSACPEYHGRGYGIEAPSHKRLGAAGGQSVAHHGMTRSLNYRLPDGGIANVTHEVADVKYPMLSVSKMNDKE